MNEVLFEILKAAVVLAAVILVRYAVPYLKMRVEESKYAWLVKWAEIAVRSVEQTITGSGDGAEKKAVVTKFLKEMLARKNIDISDSQLDNLIEAAVFAMNQGKKDPVVISAEPLAQMAGERV